MAIKTKKRRRRRKKSNFDHDQFMVCDDGWKKTSAALFLCFSTNGALIVFSHLTAFLRYSGTSLQFVSSAAAELQ